ncbi:uncharacterized protein EDB91DRAFT_1115308 [Suillus paluster]|uniref:uncharacterized protein n=1 Tax=Suillus paluster TaxID=48578 RepID=UPI001B874374|nr:uncharacterized protein EDB91DRAFT_1115308 [Suillus paluster]KAG1747891.1 hypothetical protein EDB91DRAFT_1115308 [Suillus paluster]
MSQLPPTMHSLKVTGSPFHVADFPAFNPVLARLTNVEVTIHELNVICYLLCVPTSHTRLQSLRIVYDSMDTNHVPDLFNALPLPELRLLEIRYDVTLPDLRLLEVRRAVTWPHKAFLPRSNCPLESLTFGASEMTTDEQRAEYVALIPSLEIVVDPTKIPWFMIALL